MAARRFLYIIVALIALVLAAGVVWTLFQTQLMRAALVPTVAFTPDPNAPDYATEAGWISRPGIANDPSRWTPPGIAPAEGGRVAIFYIPPTTSLRRDRWNAPLDDADANGRLRLFMASQASAFNGVGEVWAPRYRQATVGAFLTTSDNAAKALDFAYADVARAFDAFLSAIPAGQPILLAGHSQGSLHLTRLLADRIAGTPLSRRIVAAYVVGWPVSLTADLPALGLPACASDSQANCIISWQSFAEPADMGQILDIYDRTTGLAGLPRKGSTMLCTNPLTGTPNTSAPASANRGALVPRADFAGADIIAGAIPARCDPRGFLLIGAPPSKGYGAAILPGNNYHVYDYPLFWMNVRDDAARRVAAFSAR